MRRASPAGPPPVRSGRHAGLGIVENKVTVGPSPPVHATLASEMRRAAGIVALFVLAACGTSHTATNSPAPTANHGSWVQDLTFSGDVSGHMSAIVANSGPSISECTGTRSHSGDPYSDAFYGTLDGGTNVWGVTFLVNSYRGAGTYKNPDVVVQVHRPTDSTQVWQSGPDDVVSFTINTDLESGSVDADLTDARSGNKTLHLKGKWNCRG